MRMTLLKITPTLIVAFIQCKLENFTPKVDHEKLEAKNLLHLNYLHGSDHKVIDSLADMLDISANHIEPTKYNLNDPIFDGHSVCIPDKANDLVAKNRSPSLDEQPSMIIKKPILAAALTIGYLLVRFR